MLDDLEVLPGGTVDAFTKKSNSSSKLPGAVSLAPQERLRVQTKSAI